MERAGEPRRELDIRAQQRDWRAAVGYARTIEGVDASRLVLWGSSFGGGHALHLAAEDHAVVAVIAQVPHISGRASTFTQPPRLVARLIAAGVRDQIGAIAGRQPYRVAAVGYPGDVAMMTSPDAAPQTPITSVRLAWPALSFSAPTGVCPPSRWGLSRLTRDTTRVGPRCSEVDLWPRCV